jgi:hypothetical protein
MSPAKHGQMIGSPRGSRDRHRSRTRLTSGVSKIKNVFQPVGSTICSRLFGDGGTSSCLTARKLMQDTPLKDVACRARSSLR